MFARHGQLVKLCLKYAFIPTCGIRSHSSESAASLSMAAGSEGKEEFAKLAAFSARTGISFSKSSTLIDAITHRSYAEQGSCLANGRYRILGEKVLAFYVSEFLYKKYPSLPADALDGAIGSYIGPRTLSSVGRQLGVQHVMRWKGSRNKLGDGIDAAPESAVVGRVMHSLIGAIYDEKGPEAARKFVKTHFLSQSIDVSAHLKMQNPKQLLQSILKSKGKARPISRLIKETGRLSTAPVFLVGVYSGLDKIGEGYGSSLAMAETRAAKNAIESHFLKEVNDSIITVPSEADSEESRITFLE